MPIPCDCCPVPLAGCYNAPIGATSNNSTGRVLLPTPNLLPTFAFRCPDADPDDPSAVTWFNTVGDEVSAADLVPCPAT